MLENQYQDTESSMTMTAGPTEDHARIAHEDAWNASRKGKSNMPENISEVNTSMLLTIKSQSQSAVSLVEIKSCLTSPISNEACRDGQQGCNSQEPFLPGLPVACRWGASVFSVLGVSSQPRNWLDCFQHIVGNGEDVGKQTHLAFGEELAAPGKAKRKFALGELMEWRHVASY